MNCPLCQKSSERIFETHGFWLRDCAACKHRFTEISANETHVSEIYNDSYFNGGGAGYSAYLQEAEMLRKRGQMYAKKLAEFTEKKVKCLMSARRQVLFCRDLLIEAGREPV